MAGYSKGLGAAVLTLVLVAVTRVAPADGHSCDRGAEVTDRVSLKKTSVVREVSKPAAAASSRGPEKTGSATEVWQRREQRGMQR